MDCAPSSRQNKCEHLDCRKGAEALVPKTSGVQSHSGRQIGYSEPKDLKHAPTSKWIQDPAAKLQVHDIL